MFKIHGYEQNVSSRIHKTRGFIAVCSDHSIEAAVHLLNGVSVTQISFDVATSIMVANRIIHLSTLMLVYSGAMATQAFVPVVPVPLKNTFSTTSPSSFARASSSTALNANLLDRFFRVARGNLNSILQKFEDPEKVMEQATTDMQNELVTVRKSYAEVTATQRRMTSEQRQYESVADDWYRRAQLALKQNKEGLAREALARREQALERASSIKAQVESQANNIEKLYQGMQALQAQIQDARSKKNQLASRARTAKTTQSVNDMISGLTGRTSIDAFRRMEDKVEALEIPPKFLPKWCRRVGERIWQIFGASVLV